MGIFTQFPYSNFHDMNMDEILKMMKELINRMDNFIIEWSKEIEENVNKWLDEHPEATTTVVDGSLTLPKFSDDLKHITVNSYITPEMFGAVGDGITDDTAALQAMFDYISTHIATTSIVCMGKGNYLTNSITIDSPTYEHNNTALLMGFDFISTNEYLFRGNSNNHYGFVFENCRFKPDESITNGKVFRSYLFTEVTFRNCYFNGFTNVINGNVFIQMADFIECQFEDCDTVFYATGIFTLKILDCIFTNCNHVVEQILLNPDVAQTLRTVSMLQIKGCYINHYADYAIKLLAYQNVFIEKNYFENGSGEGNGIVIESSTDYTGDRSVIEIRDNNFQMTGSGNISPALFVGHGNFESVNITDNLSYNAYFAKIGNMLINKKLNFERNVRRLNPDRLLVYTYPSLKNVNAPDLNAAMTNYGGINGTNYSIEIKHGKIILSRVVNVASITKGGVFEATFNFTGFTALDVSNVEPYSYYDLVEILNCNNSNGQIVMHAIGLSDNAVGSNNRMGVLLS